MSAPDPHSTSYWPFPAIVAHRGGGTLAPENTLAGLRLASRLGYQGVEVDIKLTRDDVPILMHDDGLERTSNGHGPVARRTFAQLAKLDAGAWLAPRFAGEPIPTLAAMAKLCIEHRLWANLEIKPCPGREEATGTIAARAAANLWPNTAARPLLSSFSIIALEAARAAAPDLARGLLVEEFSEGTLRLAAELGCVSIHCQYRSVDADVAAKVHEAGFGLLCYTVNDTASASWLSLAGVDCIVTDRLDLFSPA
jgi:glycerophosphoryl diester phosphodiesterase